jgi:hypothetical protein
VTFAVVGGVWDKRGDFTLSRALKMAYVCGAGPLLLATLIFITWIFTRWSWLMAAGLVLIYVGFATVIVGAGFLGWHVFKKGRQVTGPRNAGRWSPRLAGALLMLNFPAAVGFAFMGLELHDRYCVHVVNDSGQAIESLVVTAPGVRLELGPIAAGSRANSYGKVAGDGEMAFVAHQGPAEIAGVVEGYVTNGMGGEATIRMLPSGKYDVKLQ